MCSITNTGLAQNKGLATACTRVHLESPHYRLNVNPVASPNPISAAPIRCNVFSQAIKCFARSKALTELKQFNKIKG